MVLVAGHCTTDIHRNILRSVVIDIAEGHAHPQKTLTRVVVKLHCFTENGLTEERPHDVFYRVAIARHEYVEPTIIVIVPEPGGKTPLWLVNMEVSRYLIEGAITVVMKEEIEVSII